MHVVSKTQKSILTFNISIAYDRVGNMAVLFRVKNATVSYNCGTLF